VLTLEDGRYALLNVVGGLALVTVLRLLRSKDRLEEERTDAEES